MSDEPEMVDRAAVATEPAVGDVPTMQRPGWRSALWAAIVFVLGTGLMWLGAQHQQRVIQQQTVEREIDDVLSKWNDAGGGLRGPVWSEPPPDLYVMVRDDFEFIDVSGVHPTDALRQQLSRLRRVRWLALSTETRAEDLRWIGQITQLRGLSLAGADLTGADFSCLRDLQSLQLLDLSRTHLPAQELATLPRFARLQYLMLEGHIMTGEHVLQVAQLQLPSLTHISLCDSSVSDTALIQLCKSYSLKRLWLYGARHITGESVDALGHMGTLRDLDVTFTGLSPNCGLTPEVQQLKEMLPHCSIAYID